MPMLQFFKKRKTLLINVGFVLVCLVAFFSYQALVSNVFDKSRMLKHKPAYYLLSSELIEKKASLTLISRDNTVLKREDLPLQDVEQVATLKDRVAFAGIRANNLLEITPNAKRLFYLLDDPHYTGVLSLAYTQNSLLAVMNGNLTNSGYKCLLVVQDLSGKLQKKIELPLLAEKIIANEHMAYVVGAQVDANGNFSSALVSIDLENYKISSYVGIKDSKYKDILICQNKLYCLKADMYDNKNEIVLHDPNSLELQENYHFKQLLDTIYTYEGKLYALSDAKIYEIKQGKLGDIVHELPSDVYFEQKCQQGEHLYILCQTEGGQDSFDDYTGQIIDISLRYGSKVVTDFVLPKQAKRMITFAPVPKE